MTRHLTSWLSNTAHIIIAAILGKMIFPLHPNAHKEGFLYMIVTYAPSEVRTRKRFQYRNHLDLPWDHFTTLRCHPARPEGLPSDAFSQEVQGEIEAERQKMEDSRAPDDYGVVMLVLEVIWGQRSFLVAVPFPLNRNIAMALQCEGGEAARKWRAGTHGFLRSKLA